MFPSCAFHVGQKIGNRSRTRPSEKCKYDETKHITSKNKSILSRLRNNDCLDWVANTFSRSGDRLKQSAVLSSLILSSNAYRWLPVGIIFSLISPPCLMKLFSPLYRSLSPDAIFPNCLTLPLNVIFTTFSLHVSCRCFHHFFAIYQLMLNFITFFFKK